MHADVIIIKSHECVHCTLYSVCTVFTLFTSFLHVVPLPSIQMAWNVRTKDRKAWSLMPEDRTRAHYKRTWKWLNCARSRDGNNARTVNWWCAWLRLTVWRGRLWANFSDTYIFTRQMSSSSLRIVFVHAFHWRIHFDFSLAFRFNIIVHLAYVIATQLRLIRLWQIGENSHVAWRWN